MDIFIKLTESYMDAIVTSFCVAVQGMTKDAMPFSFDIKKWS